MFVREIRKQWPNFFLVRYNVDNLNAADATQVYNIEFPGKSVIPKADANYFSFLKRLHMFIFCFYIECIPILIIFRNRTVITTFAS